MLTVAGGLHFILSRLCASASCNPDISRYPRRSAEVDELVGVYAERAVVGAVRAVRLFWAPGDEARLRLRGLWRPCGCCGASCTSWLIPAPAERAHQAPQRQFAGAGRTPDRSRRGCHRCGFQARDDTSSGSVTIEWSRCRHWSSRPRHQQTQQRLPPVQIEDTCASVRRDDRRWL